jgi:hypothetical protein
MCKLRKLAVFCIFFLLVIGLFLTCEDPNDNPFSPSLGPKVVVEPPTINIDFPVSGAYITSSEFMKNPVTGEISFEPIIFTGRTQAYIKVEKVEVYVFEDKENGQIERKWTDKGIRLTGDLKNKRWTYEFNPNNYNNYIYDSKTDSWTGPTVAKDGPVRMLFRVFDSTGNPVESVPLVYIIKNRPSIVRMSSPASSEIENPEKISDVPYGGDIRGTVIDRRGLRPGYPQIQLWPVARDSSFQYDPENPDSFVDDERWGWASLFLSNYDDMQKEGINSEGEVIGAGKGVYADRNNMRVVNTSSFTLRLAEYKIVVDPDNPDWRRVEYALEDNPQAEAGSGKKKHILFGAGRVFNFRIRTKDTSSDPLNKMFPTDDGPFIEGFFPSMNFGIPEMEDPFLYRTDPSGRGLPVKFQVYNSDLRPTVEIDNSDIAPTVLAAKPNIYITESTSKNIGFTVAENKDIFRLRLRAELESGIYDARLEWIHESSGRSGRLEFDNPVTFPVNEAFFQFTAKSGLLGNDGKQVFSSSSGAYTLIFYVRVNQDPSSKEADYRFTVYIDGENPTVNIRSVRGAAVEPAAGAASVPGGLINSSPYTVNGNIQVAVERTDDSGIMNHKKDNDETMGKEGPDANYPMVKWIIERVDPSSPDAPATAGTVYADLIKYKNTPSAANLKFFNDIGEMPNDFTVNNFPSSSGWVRRPVSGATLAADKSHHFKLNTFKQDPSNPAINLWQWKADPAAPDDPEKGGPFLWLYIIAQDQVQNLGFIVQKIKVDDETDKPVVNVRTLSKENADGKQIANEDDLDVSVSMNGATRLMSGNWKENKRNNILGRNQGIDLNITDDDGIKLSDIIITLTAVAPTSDIPGANTVTINASEVLKSGGSRDRSGVLSQTIMAAKLYGAASEGILKDGMYKIEFAVKDDADAKVDIPPGYRTPTPPNPPLISSPSLTGDTPATSVEAKATYYFAVSTTMPKVDITYPDDNAWGSEEPIIITGTVKSRLNIKSLWITFTPNVVHARPGSTNPPSVPISVALIPPAAGTANPDNEGFYNYTWSYAGEDEKGVIFHPGDGSVRFFSQTDYPLREFAVEAYDRIGNMGTSKRNVQIDAQGPDITISDFNYGRPPDIVNNLPVHCVYGKVPFTVSASDANGLQVIDGKSGIKWWVVKKGAAVPTWLTGYGATNNPDSNPDTGFRYSNPLFTPAVSPTTWTGYGYFNSNQARDGGKFTWVIDTRYLENGETYRLYIIALDKAGNPSTSDTNDTSWYEEFKVDWKRDYPTIAEDFIEPKKSDVKSKNPTISGSVSDIDNFNPEKKNTYVSIRFPKASVTGKPVSANDWDEWILLKINDTYTASLGGIDSSGAIVYKFKASNYTTPVDPPEGALTDTLENRAYMYLNKDGVKYYQIRVTDEPARPTDAQKAAGAKWYGKNPDSFMPTATDQTGDSNPTDQEGNPNPNYNPNKGNPLYPGYPYVAHNSVTIVFPASPADFIINPSENPPDSYSLIVDGTYPEIFFDTWDPTKENAGNKKPHPNYSEARPTFSSVDLLIAALKGHVEEYKLSKLSMNYTVKGTTFRKTILDVPEDKDPPSNGEYKWNLGAATTENAEWNFALTNDEKTALTNLFRDAEQGMQIITFEATDMVPYTRRVSYIFAKDTQGPAINFNSIGRSIERKTNALKPLIPGIPAPGVFPTKVVGSETVIDWSDWRYGGTAWQATSGAWNDAWRKFISYWPSEYAFVFKTAATVIAQLEAEDALPASTVIGDPEDKKTQAGYSPPVIEGNFSDLYSSIRITVPATAKTYFYYRFKDKDGNPLSIPTGKTATLEGIPPGITPPQPGVPGDWMRKEIEESPKDASGKPTQNEKEANWKIRLNEDDGFTGKDGLNMLDIWVADTAGNISDIYNVRFLLDRTPPILGKEPNESTHPTNPGNITDADEFIIVSYAKYASSAWTTQPLNQPRPEMQRVFSADGTTNTPTATNAAFTIKGTVSDHNFSGMTITIGQEGFVTYSVTVSLEVDPTKATTTDPTGKGAGTNVTSDGRLKLEKLADLADGTPQWEWTFNVLHKDVKELRDAAKNGTIDASDSTRRYIRVTASDKAGKRVGPVDWFFYLDTKKPTLEYTNLKTGTLTSADSFEDGKLALSGLVEDDTRINDVQFMIGRWSYANKRWEWYNGTWTNVLPDRSTWPSAFAGLDPAPTRQTSMSWSINQATLTAVGTKFPENLFDNEGYYRLDLYITDFSLGDGNPHYTYLDGDNFDDARINTPSTGTGLRSGRVFYIDKDDPILKWGWFVPGANGQLAADPNDIYNPNNTTYFRNDKGQAKFSFTVGDGNTIQYLSAEVKKPDGPPEDATKLSGSIKWEILIDKDHKTEDAPANPIPLPANGSDKFSTAAINEQRLIIAPYMTTDGTGDTDAAPKALDKVDGNSLPTYTIIITVKDGAGRTSSISKQFTLDNLPPRFIQDNFNPSSYKLGTASKPADPDEIPATGYTDTTKRTYSYDAVTGRMNMRGSTTDNSNQIRNVSYYVVNSTDDGLPGLTATTYPTPDEITAKNLWRYSGGTDKNAPEIKIGTGANVTTLMEIDQGTFAWRIMVPKTSMFINDTDAQKYAQQATTGGLTLKGEGPVTASKYKDVTITTTGTMIMSTSEKDVPYLTFADLAKDPSKFPLNDKTIYGGEKVALITVYVRAEDMAGNVAYDVLKYWIWPEGDRPIVTAINTPNAAAPAAERLLNGTIRLSGMAKDNERVKNVWFRVFPSKDGKIDPPNAQPIELTIPKWDKDWNAIPGSKQDPVSDETGDGTPPPFNRTGYNGFLGGRRVDDPSTSVQIIGGGWYMANGGNSPEVSWYAYINTNGELNPTGTDDRKEFYVEVRAQDTTYDDKNDEWTEYTPTWRGMASVPLSTYAWVVSELPKFEDQLIAPDTSVNAEAPTPKLWKKLDEISLRGTSSYKVTVKHEKIGISAIRWSPTLWDKTLNSGSGGFQANPSLDSFNLVTLGAGQSVYLNSDGKGYTVGTTVPADSGMALRVIPKKQIAGTNPAIYEEYDVFVDIRADVLLTRMTTDDPDYGSYEDGRNKTEANRGRAGQVKNSVRYPVYLSASDVSKATPLTARGDAFLPIDNLEPFGMYTLNRKPAGTAVTIGGEAGDLGPVNGIARVVMWFQRGSTGVSWHEVGKTGTNPPPATEAPYDQPGTFTVYPGSSDGPQWWNAVTYGAGANDVIPTTKDGFTVRKPYIPTETAAGANIGSGASAIVIDTNSPSKGVGKWGLDLPMGFADGGLGKIWYVEINSYGIQSGPVDLHYVIIDKAGNATYYKERLVIMNNVAVIDRIKLATDIRHSGFPTGNLGNLATGNPDDGKINDKVDLVPGQWPILNSVRDAVKLGGSATDIKDDVKKGISDWVYSNSMGANKIIDFNVRNNMFALRVETTKRPVSKNRTFRVEYISGAALLENTARPDGTADKTQLENITKGRIYMINNPGTAKWGMFGADGDGPWPRGYAFIATISGTELDDTAKRNIGVGSAWQINTVQTIDAGGQDAAGASTAASAEFRFGTNAFGTAAGRIPDYTTANDVTDAVFPPTPNADYSNWTTWTAAAQPLSLFIIRAFDGPETDYFGDFTIIRVRVNNDDRTKPFAQLYDINPKTEGQERQNIAKVGNSTANELTRSISPMFIGEGVNSNRTKGGLWNADLENIVAVKRPGHIEPRQITYTNTPPYTGYQHSLSSEQMGGAETLPGTLKKPYADPRGFFTADTVSGKVVLRGYAEDDQRIQRVSIKFNNDNEIPILLFQASNATAGQPGYGTAGNTDSSSANFSPPRTGLLQAAGANQAERDRVYFTDSIDAYRHRVEWAFVWDTEATPNTIVGEVTVLVTAYNRSGTLTNTDTNNGVKTASDTMNANTANGNNARKVHSDDPLANKPLTSPFNPGFPVGLYEYNQITMNLRPYITGFLRDQTQFSHNNRSRQGRYMFYRGETAVVTGFNLSTGTLRINATDLTTDNVPNTAAELSKYGITAANNQHYRRIAVGATQITGTGMVRYAVGTRYAVNTGTAEANTNRDNRLITTTPVIRPNFIQPWNIEFTEGEPGSDLWDDFTQVHIWQSQERDANNNLENGPDRGRFPKGTNLEVFDPAMSVDPATGTLWSSHNEGGGGGTQGNNDFGSANNTGSTKVGNNNGNGTFVSASFIDPIINSDIYISPTTSRPGNYTVWTAYSIIGRSGSTGSWKDYGGVYVSGPQGTNPGLSNGAVGRNGSGNNMAPITITNDGFGNNTHNALSQYLVESTGYNAGTNTEVNVNWPPGNVDFNAPSRNQFNNPHIVTWTGRGTLTNDTASSEHIHVAYYDTKDGSIKYRYNRRNNPGAMAGVVDIGQGANNTTRDNSLNRNVMPLAWTNLDGGYDYDDTAPFNNNSQGWTSDRNNDLNNNGDGYGANGGNYTTPFSNFTGALNKNARVVNQSSRPAAAANRIDAGEYNSIAITNQGYPVIAYFDKTNQKLKLAISNATVPIGADRWRIIENVIPTDNSNWYGTGMYVSMKIDSRNATNVVHIAAMNAASKNVIYVRGTLTYSNANPPLATFTIAKDSNSKDIIHVVDSVGSVGRWCALSLDSAGNPYIAYQDESYQGSRDGVKLAFYNTTTFYKGRVTYSTEDKDLYGADINGWEAMHIPTRFRVNNARVGMECYPVLNPQYTGGTATKFWSGAVGYLGEDYFRVAYYVK